MKKSSVTMYSPTTELPTLTRKITRRFSRRKNRLQGEQLLNTVQPPSEERTAYLNQLAQEYPFCVYYKQKDYDPL